MIDGLKLTGTLRALDTLGTMHLLLLSKEENYKSPSQDVHPIPADQNQRMTC